MIFQKYIKSMIISLVLFFVLTLLITLLNQVGILSFNFINIFKYFIIFIFMFVGSFILGKKSLKKGWFEGLKFGLMMIILFTIITLIFYKFNAKQLISYSIMLLASILGSIVGINKKEVKEKST